MAETVWRRPYKELSLQQLKSFCAVCRAGSYSAAARELALTGPAVWEQLKALERHFDTRLFERQGNGVRPTRQGEQLLDLVRPLLAGLESTREVMQQRDGILPRQLSIVTNLRVLAEEIGQAMARFRQRYSTIQLLVTYASSEEVEPLVVDGGADVALTLEPGPDEQARSPLVYEPAGAIDYLLLTPPKHRLMRDKSLSLAAIARHPLILSRPQGYSRHRVQEVFHRHDLLNDLQIAVQTSSDEYTPACVRAGLGVGIVIGNATSPLYHSLGVRSLRRWLGTARVGFLWRRGAHVPALSRELADFLRAALK